MNDPVKLTFINVVDHPLIFRETVLFVGVISYQGKLRRQVLTTRQQKDHQQDKAKHGLVSSIQNVGLDQRRYLSISDTSFAQHLPAMFAEHGCDGFLPDFTVGKPGPGSGLTNIA